MIVKNESHIIIDTLEKLINKITFDYYVICDTGSTDNTIGLIKEYFEKEKIPGEFFSHEWKDFGYNRSLALQCAYGKSDYVFIFDADDEIIGNINLSNLTLDSYTLKFGNHATSYERICLIRNDNTWYYRGVLHEYICSKNENTPSKGSIQGDYFINSGRTSSRNRDPNKYLNDAKILEKGYYSSIETGDNIHHRYAYYCANSYMDAGNREKAKEWYVRTLKCQGWYDERYNSCLQLFELTKESKDSFYYLVESFYHNPRRIEGIYLLINHYTCEGKYDLAWKYYQWIQNYYENEYPFDELSTKLFARVMDYTFYLPYYMIIVSEKTKNYSTGLKMFEIIFDKKDHGSVPGQWWVDNLLFNFQFFEMKILSEKFKIYVDFLKSHMLTIKYDYFPDKLNESILFYTGFAKEPWNLSYSENYALGGSERAVINLAKELSKWYSIVITGDILDETNFIGKGITFINRHKLKNVHYKFIIVSRYLSFFTLFPNYKCEKLILMAHDTHLLNNLNGCNKTAQQLIDENKIDFCVCLTNWQKKVYSNLYPKLKIHVINNGIKNTKKLKVDDKIPNTFIYTSGSIRGLERLLNIWPEIISNIPDATLNISSYEDFPKDSFDESLNINQKGITHLGKLNESELYKLMHTSEYWLYPCCFDETSCITAMEMMDHGVICLYYPRAGLTDTMNGNGIQISNGNEIETLINLTSSQKSEIIFKAKEYANGCSWENRAIEWIKIIEGTKSLIFYAKNNFPMRLLDDYINSLKTSNKIEYTNSFDFIKNECGNFDEIVFVHEVFDQRVFNLNCKVSYLNTEPLNIFARLNYIIYDLSKYKFKNFYDYSLSNIKILNNNNINNTKFLPYLYNHTEVNFLRSLLLNKKEYEFGIICSNGLLTNNVEELKPPRRKKVVSYLLSQGFKVNIISGFGPERDIEISKCKCLLNIHGQFIEEPSQIFEHIRCDRLLYAGYNILSENSIYMDENFKFPNLKFIDYCDFFKIKNKIIDCFTFYNELELLSYRLNILQDVVDYFIIIESTLTHIGKPKKLYFQENKHLFEKENFFERIIHIVVDDFPFKYPNIDISKNQQWENEKFQRNCITRGLDKLTLYDNDVIIISDLDEIPDPNTIKNTNSFDIACLEQDFYYYNLNSKMDHKWYHPKIMKYHSWISSNLTFSDIRLKNYNIIKKGGWHLSYFGSSQFISNKIQNFGHQEYNSETFTNIESINEKLKKRVDIYNRKIHIEFKSINSNDYLPPNYIQLSNFIIDDSLSYLSLKYHLDKNVKIFHDYIPIYEKFVKQNKHLLKNVLEIGIGSTENGQMTHVKNYKTGNSLRCWRDYFPNATIHGIDIYECILNEERIKTYKLDQSNESDLNTLEGPFELIIDDGSHIMEHQIFSFNILSKKLSYNGIYVIEDIHSENREIIKETFSNLKEFNVYFFYNGYDNVCVLEKKFNSVTVCPNIGMGYGNVMFQIAEAVYYCEKYNYKLCINKYYERFFTHIWIKDQPDENTIKNDYTFNRIEPTKNIRITGFSQNVDLFYDVKEKLSSYFNFDCEEIKNKYSINDSQINVVLGFRLNADSGFKYSNLSMKSYESVMEKFKSARFFVISDIDPSNFLINCKYNVEIVNETDINQFCLGLCCNHFIIGESTFHYWIALLKTIKDPTTQVYIFNDTDITNRNLHKNLNWKIVNKVNDFIYLHLQDQSGCDYKFHNGSVNVLRELAINDPNCIGFNTMGHFKNEIKCITPLLDWGPNEGIYLKKKKNYCFIHSCNLPKSGTKRLDYLLEKLSSFDIFEKILVNNIGVPINKNYNKIELINYSNNHLLFELPTINKVLEFSKSNPNVNVLYLHTKGIVTNNTCVDDWIEMMIHFLLKQICLEKLYTNDVVGCNYNDFSLDYHKDGTTTPAPPHFSGNFWWAQSNYLSTLPFIKGPIKKNDCEYHLFKNNPIYHCLHNSYVNHYNEKYPKERYNNQF